MSTRRKRRKKEEPKHPSLHQHETRPRMYYDGMAATAQGYHVWRCARRVHDKEAKTYRQCPATSIVLCAGTYRAPCPYCLAVERGEEPSCPYRTAEGLYVP